MGSHYALGARVVSIRGVVASAAVDTHAHTMGGLGLPFLGRIPRWKCWVMSCLNFNPPSYQTITRVTRVVKGSIFSYFLLKRPGQVESAWTPE